MLDEEEEKDIFLAVIEPRRCRYKGHMETREREDQLSKIFLRGATLSILSSGAGLPLLMFCSERQTWLWKDKCLLSTNMWMMSFRNALSRQKCG